MEYFSKTVLKMNLLPPVKNLDVLSKKSKSKLVNTTFTPDRVS